MLAPILFPNAEKPKYAYKRPRPRKGEGYSVISQFNSLEERLKDDCEDSPRWSIFPNVRSIEKFAQKFKRSTFQYGLPINGAWVDDELNERDVFLVIIMKHIIRVDNVFMPEYSLEEIKNLYLQDWRTDSAFWDNVTRENFPVIVNMYKELINEEYEIQTAERKESVAECFIPELAGIIAGYLGNTVPNQSIILRDEVIHGVEILVDVDDVPEFLDTDYIFEDDDAEDAEDGAIEVVLPPEVEHYDAEDEEAELEAEYDEHAVEDHDDEEEEVVYADTDSLFSSLSYLRALDDAKKESKLKFMQIGGRPYIVDSESGDKKILEFDEKMMTILEKTVENDQIRMFNKPMYWYAGYVFTIGKEGRINKLGLCFRELENGKMILNYDGNKYECENGILMRKK